MLITPESVTFVYAVVGAGVGALVGFAIGLALALNVTERINAKRKG